jgi:hypothetical protein
VTLLRTIAQAENGHPVRPTDEPELTRLIAAGLVRTEGRPNERAFLTVMGERACFEELEP